MSIYRILSGVAFGLLLGFLLGSWSHRAAMPETAVSGETIVATVGIHPITLAALERTLTLPLYMAAQQRQQLLLQGVQRLVDQELLATEASKRNISVSELLDEASQSELVANLANLPGPVRRLSTNPTRAGQRETLPDPEQRARIRQALLVALRRQSDVRITLPSLEPPILPVSADDDPRLGPDNAPVTVVEFSDFQCPFCQKSVGVLRELQRVYGDKIRLIYRDFPGQNHPYAWPAAEAAQCAQEQGKFWEYHDLLFARQSPGTTWDFLALAGELHLQADAFSGCLHSGRLKSEVYNDVQDGLRLGITSTPTFFINGRPLIGSQPLSAFQALIDKALQDQQHP
jgi:protein-disulfide isomerase